MRTHYCGLVSESDIDNTVTLYGWVDRRRDHGGVIFLDMRDREGIVQVVFDPDTEAAFALADRVRREYVLKITGRVRARGEGTVNPAMATGSVEVLGKEIDVLSESAKPPFPLDAHHSVGEDVRLKFRYMDLRRPEMPNNLMFRARLTSSIRQYLDGHGFLDIETPILTRATPEGARDYLVPSRTHEGDFFALPQSPQLFKQLLMIAIPLSVIKISKVLFNTFQSLSFFIRIPTLSSMFSIIPYRAAVDLSYPSKRKRFLYFSGAIRGP